MASFVRHGKKVCVCLAKGDESNKISSDHTCFYYQIVAIGRNYAAHAKELNHAVPQEPFFFLKPTSSYLPSGGKLEIPVGIVAHHEGTHSENRNAKNILPYCV